MRPFFHCFGVTVVLLVMGCSGNSSKVEVTSAIQPEFHRKSTVFSAKVDGKELFVEHFKAIHYADFSLSGTAGVQVTFHEPVEQVRISPWKLGITSVIKENTIRFNLPGAGWYVVEVNDSTKLILLADRWSEEVAPQQGVISVLDFVKNTDGSELQTEALQQAIDEAGRTGDTLFFPAGIYRTGTLRIGSNTNIYLADGAMIKGSEDRKDYPTDGDRLEADHIHNQENYSDNGEFMTFSRLILIDSATNVHIWGKGIIDGSGTVLRAQGKPANLLRIRNSRNVLVEGVILRDPAAWNTHILHSEDVTIRGVKVLNDFAVANTDGFDPDASKRVLIDGCFAYCNDDNIAIKTTNNMGLLQDLEDVTVRNCVFITRKSSLKVGTETKGAYMRNILFENNDVVECDRGLALYCNDGAVFENVRFVNNRIERNFPDSQRKAIHFSIKDRNGAGYIRNILVKDCHFLEAFPKGSAMDGLDDEHCIDGIVFENVTVGGKKVLEPAGLGIAKMKFVKNVTFK